MYNVNLLKKEVVSLLGKDINECYDTKYLFSLYQENHNNLYMYKSFNNGINKLKIDILENYILYLFQKNNRTLEEENVLKKASSFYNELGKGKKSFLLNNMIFNNMRYLGKSFFKDYDVIVENIKSTSKEVREYYNLYINDKLNDDVKKIRLMEFLIGKIGNNNYKNTLENVFSKLLNSNKNLLISEKNLLVQYINYNKCQRLGLPLAKIYITKKPLYGEDFGDNVYGESYNDTGIICLNQKYYGMDFNLKVGNISLWLFCLNIIHHELEHYKQDCEVSKGVLNESSFSSIKDILFRIYFSNSEFNEYKTNYEYREVEREANVNGWRDTAKLLQTYAKDTKFKEIEQAYYISRKTNMEKANSWQKKKINDKEKKITIETYNVKNLIEIVKDNPNLLRNYPQLKEFFDDNGKIYSPFTFFEKYTKLELQKTKTDDKEEYKALDEKLKCYDEFIDYLFINKNFETLNFDGYNNYETMITFFSLLGQKFFEECNKIKDMCNTFDVNNLGDFYVILNKRKDRLSKYYSFILKNQALIQKLNIYNQEHLDERHRLFNWYLDVEKLNSELKSVDRHIDRLKSNNEILRDDNYGRRI